MSCPFCKRMDTNGLMCDDDHCREYNVTQEHGHRPTPTDNAPASASGSAIVSRETPRSGPSASVSGKSVVSEARSASGEAGGRVPVSRSNRDAALGQAANVLSVLQYETAAMEAAYRCKGVQE